MRDIQKYSESIRLSNKMLIIYLITYKNLNYIQWVKPYIRDVIW